MSEGGRKGSGKPGTGAVIFRGPGAVPGFPSAFKLDTPPSSSLCGVQL